MKTETKIYAVYRQSPRLAQRRIGGELFIVDPQHQCLHQPLDSGEALWEWLAAGATEDDLVGRLCQRYDVTEPRARKDVRRYLSELRRKKMIEGTS